MSAKLPPEIILGAATPGAALKGTWEHQKRANPKLTLGALCRKIGIKSTGYLADVFGGRRKLGPAYWQPLLSALGIDGAAAEYLSLKLAVEREPELGKDAATMLRLETLAKLVGSTQGTLPDRIRQVFFAFEVFSAFGLFRNKPTRTDLRGYFGAARGIELDLALHVLKSLALIEEGDEGAFHLLSDHVNFSDADDGLSHLDFLRLALRDADDKLARLYEQRGRTFFSSSIVSVREAAFVKALPAIKERIRLIESELETGDADRLVRFNIQIYPIE